MKAHIERAKALRADGASLAEIAETLGVAISTVHRWVVPGSAEAHRATSRLWKEMHRDENRRRDRNRHRQLKGLEPESEPHRVLRVVPARMLSRAAPGCRCENPLTGEDGYCVMCGRLRAMAA